MAFIKKIIGPDEQLIGMTTIHWIYGAKGLFWMAGFMIAGSLTSHVLTMASDSLEITRNIAAIDVIAGYIFWVCAAIGLLMLLLYVLLMVTTEIALTSKRIIYKKGWVAVKVKEVDLEEIKAADVDNGALGRILNYGFVKFDARFVENIDLPAVSDPYRFVKALNEARSLLKQNSGMMNVVLDGATDTPQQATVTQQPAAPPQTVKTQPPPPPPAHDMNEPRYDSISSNPATALAGMVNDMADGIVHSGEVQGGHQVMQGKDSFAPPEPMQPDPPRAMRPQTASAPPAQPVIFERDPQQQKEELRQKIKGAFSRKTRRKAS